jgi:hypothetical protein
VGRREGFFVAMRTETLTLEELKSELDYNPETGIFTRLVNRPKCKAGDTAGWLTCYGYIQISVKQRKYFAHRLAWFYMTGEWPKETIDHCDTVKSNNRFQNLRPASQSENNQNWGMLQRNKSGVKGVSWKKDKGKWRAHFNGIKNKCVFVGYFSDLKTAELAMIAAREKYHQQYANHAI